MERVVGLVNKLQQICSTVGDNALSENSALWNQLVTIVVIGGQSSGKSSVLEAVVGRDFLPRGTGIVTRRPLVLQLVKLNDPKAAEYGEFAHSPNKKWSNFDQIRQEIEDETERLIRRIGRAVSPEPIFLTVYSPNVPNLTLVDMPGLTKVPIDGQPASIVQDLEEMVKKYIKGDNAIILAVSPANADLATSDAIRMAREVDPYFERTIGVMTKVDIMDRGTDCKDILQGRTLRLKNGWVAVVNRGQKDINDRVPMLEARSREKAFFVEHPAYKELNNVGTGFLTEKLSNHLVQEIMRKLPKIQQFIDTSIAGMKKELQDLGADVMGNRGQMLHLILRLLQKVEKAFEKTVDGGTGGGERVLEIFEIKLKDAIQKLPFDKILTLKNVRNIVNEADGYQPHIIAPENGYRRLIEEGLSLLREPANTAVGQVFAILKNILSTAINSPDCGQLARFTNLKAEIVAHSAKTLEDLKLSSEQMVRTLVDMEASYLSANFFREIVAAESYGNDNRLKPQFMTLNGELLFDKKYDNLPPAERHMQRISDHVSAYLHVVRSQLLATVPKAIVHCLTGGEFSRGLDKLMIGEVVPAKSNLLGKLQEDVAGKDEVQLTRLLGETEDAARRREEVRKRLEMMEKAAREISMFG